MHATFPNPTATADLFSIERRRRRLMEFLKAFDGHVGPASVSLLSAVAPDARRIDRPLGREIRANT
jgi:hypothetical protein